MIATPPEALEARARAWQRALGPQAQVLPGLSTIGGGSLPGETLPTWLLALPGPGEEEVARRLRHHRPPVVGRIEEDRLCLDPRTVLPEEDPLLLQAVRHAWPRSQ